MSQAANIVENKKNKVRAMFDGIARSYDFLNHFLSFGIDYYWRKRLISEASRYSPGIILDMATGTADLAIMAARIKPSKILGGDLSPEMLEVGRKKVMSKNLENLIELQLQDAEALTFGNETFDLVMVAFGVRNFENLSAGIDELYRVLKPGKPLLILEFSTPSNSFFKFIYHFYSFKILPFIGRMISKNRSAYHYLPESIRTFPCGEQFISLMKASGFTNCRYISMTMGIATLYVGERKK